MIYLDSAATTLRKPPSVARACAYAVDHLATPGRGGHRPAMAAAETAFACRREAAALFDVPEPDRVVFTFNATHGLNIAIKTLVKPGSTVLISGYEHNAVTRPLRAIPGVTVKAAESPLFDRAAALEAFRRELTPQVDAVVCTHVSNVFGFILPIESIAALCRQRRVPLIVDASQSAGCLPLSFRELGAAFIAMPGHKGLLGPHGTGALWVADGVTLAPLRQGGTGSASESMFQPRIMPDSLESGTLNLPGIAGLYAGMRFALAHQQEARETTAALCGMMRDALREMAGVRVYTRADASLLSFNVAGIASQVVASALDEQGIAVRGGLHCAPGVHRFLGTLNIGAVRVSPGLMNTAAEAGKLIDAVWKIAKAR